jgi:bile acid:Na+ symporter, BASS family
MSLAALTLIVLKASIFLTVLSLGLRATGREAVSLVREPSRLARSIGAMMVVMPAVAVLLAQSFDLHPTVKIALVALSVSPVPPIWPRRSLKSGGDEAFTLGLLVASALLAIVIIPSSMEVFQRIFALPLRMSAGAVARMVVITILLPLFLGITVRRLAPGLAGKTARPLGLVASVLLVSSVVPLVVSLWSAMTSLIGDGTLLAMIAFVVAGLAVGHSLGGPARADRSVLALACTSRHPAIAVAIAHVNFPGQKLVPAAIVLYLLLSAIVVTPYLKWIRRPERRATKPITAVATAGVRSPPR